MTEPIHPVLLQSYMSGIRGYSGHFENKDVYILNRERCAK